MIGGWWSRHLELDWRNPLFRRYCGMLGERFTVIRYDRPGSGLSDRDGPPVTGLDDEVAVLAALVDQVGERVSLLGGSSGGCVATAYTATHPERVDRLVLYGCYAYGDDIAEQEARESVLAIVAKHWGVGSRILADIFLPNGTAKEREELVRFQRASTTAEDAVRSLRAVYEFDVREFLATIKTPTVVLHRRDDRAIPFALGRELASRIPGASFVALDGNDHFPWLGDMESVARATLGFLGADDAPHALEATLSTREVEVLTLVARGMGDREIAERLVLSVHTVHRHVANIRTKLGLTSRAAAAAYAAKSGLL